GGRYNGAVRLYQFGGRVQDALRGIWLQQDPAGPVKEPNLYQFADSNPLTPLTRVAISQGIPGLALLAAWQVLSGAVQDYQSYREYGFSAAEASGFVAATRLPYVNLPIMIAEVYTGTSLQAGDIGQPLTGWGYGLRVAGIALELLFLRGLVGGAGASSLSKGAFESRREYWDELRTLVDKNRLWFLEPAEAELREVATADVLKAT